MIRSNAKQNYITIIVLFLSTYSCILHNQLVLVLADHDDDVWLLPLDEQCHICVSDNDEQNCVFCADTEERKEWDCSGGRCYNKRYSVIISGECICRNNNNNTQPIDCNKESLIDSQHLESKADCNYASEDGKRQRLYGIIVGSILGSCFCFFLICNDNENFRRCFSGDENSNSTAHQLRQRQNQQQPQEQLNDDDNFNNNNDDNNNNNFNLLDYNFPATLTPATAHTERLRNQYRNSIESLLIIRRVISTEDGNHNDDKQNSREDTPRYLSISWIRDMFDWSSRSHRNDRSIVFSDPLDIIAPPSSGNDEHDEEEEKENEEDLPHDDPYFHRQLLNPPPVSSAAENNDNDSSNNNNNTTNDQQQDEERERRRQRRLQSNHNPIKRTAKQSYRTSRNIDTSIRSSTRSALSSIRSSIGRNSKSNNKKDDLGNDLPTHCDICLDEYEVNDEVCWSPNVHCTHVFHKECIFDWLLHNDSCPCCRRDYLKVDNSNEEVRDNNRISNNNNNDNQV